MYFSAVLGSVSIRNFSCDQLYPKNNLLLTALVVSGVVGVLIAGVGAGHFFAQNHMLHGWLANFNFLGNVSQGVAIGLTAGGGSLMVLGLYGLIGMVKKTSADNEERRRKALAKGDFDRLTNEYLAANTAKLALERELAGLKALIENRDGDKEKVKERPKGELESLRSYNENILNELREKTAQIEKLNEAAKKAFEEVKSLQLKQTATEKELAAKTAEVEEAKAKVLKFMVKMSELESSAKALVEEHRALKEKLEEKEAHLLAAQSQSEKCQEQLKGCQAKMAGLEEEFAAVMEEAAQQMGKAKEV